MSFSDSSRTPLGTLVISTFLSISKHPHLILVHLEFNKYVSKGVTTVEPMMVISNTVFVSDIFYIQKVCS